MNNKCHVNLHTRGAGGEALHSLWVGCWLMPGGGPWSPPWAGGKGLSPRIGLAVSSTLTSYQGIFSSFQLLQIVQGKRQVYHVDESNIEEGFIRSVSVAKFEKGVGWLLTMLTPVSLLDPVLLFQIVGNSCKQVMGKDTFYACVGGTCWSHCSRQNDISVCVLWMCLSGSVPLSGVSIGCECVWMSVKCVLGVKGGILCVLNGVSIRYACDMHEYHVWACAVYIHIWWVYIWEVFSHVIVPEYISLFLCEACLSVVVVWLLYVLPFLPVLRNNWHTALYKF